MSDQANDPDVAPSSANEPEGHGALPQRFRARKKSGIAERKNTRHVGADLKLTRRADLKLTRGGDGHARWPSVDNSTVCFC